MITTLSKTSKVNKNLEGKTSKVNNNNNLEGETSKANIKP